MNLSICSFSYHRAVLAGQQDFFGYLAESQRAGATHLHFWIPHLLQNPDLTAMKAWDWRPGSLDIPAFLHAPRDAGWITEMCETIAGSGLKIEMIAMEKAFMHTRDPAASAEHEQFLLDWLHVAAGIGCPAMRVDPGGPATDYTADDQQRAIERYQYWVDRAKRDFGVQLFVENHWGMSQEPEFLKKLLDEVDGLGYLLDTANWGTPERRARGWELLAPYAGAVHVKTRQLGADLQEATYDIGTILQRLVDLDYNSIWGIESVPTTAEEEITAVNRTRDLIASIA